MKGFLVGVLVFSALCLAMADSDDMTAFYLSKAGAVGLAGAAWGINYHLVKLSKGGRRTCTQKSRGIWMA